jgi:hypothetical protein
MTSAGNNTATVHSKLVPTGRNISTGCVGYIVLTELSSSKSTIRSIAEAIREQITCVREPENLRRVVGLSNELFEQATESGRFFWWFPYEGAVGINNTFNMPTHNQHFGYPGSTRFCELTSIFSFVLHPNDLFSVQDMYNSRERVRAMFPESHTFKLTLIHLVLADLARKSSQTSRWHLEDICRWR